MSFSLYCFQSFVYNILTYVSIKLGLGAKGTDWKFETDEVTHAITAGFHSMVKKILIFLMNCKVIFACLSILAAKLTSCALPLEPVSNISLERWHGVSELLP